MRCPYCGYEHPPDTTVCPVTGRAMSAPVCPHCGRAVDPSWPNCGYCGRSLARQAAPAPTPPTPLAPALSPEERQKQEVRTANRLALFFFVLAFLLLLFVLWMTAGSSPAPQTASGPALWVQPTAALQRASTRPPLPTPTPQPAQMATPYPTASLTDRLWKLIPYSFTSETRADGWVYSQVSLAFQYTGAGLSSPLQVNTILRVRTQEGRDYPAIITTFDYNLERFRQSSFTIDASIPAGTVLSNNANSHLKITFRTPQDAHPERITFDYMPAWNIDLSSVRASPPPYPGQPDEGLSSISVLKDHQAFEAPGSWSLVLDGTCSVLRPVWGSATIRIPYRIINHNQTEPVLAQGTAGRISFIGPQGIYHSTDTTFFEGAEPGKTVTGQFTFWVEYNKEDPLTGLLILRGGMAGPSSDYLLVPINDCSLDKS